MESGHENPLKPIIFHRTSLREGIGYVIFKPTNVFLRANFWPQLSLEGFPLPFISICKLRISENRFFSSRSEKQSLKIFVKKT